MPTCCRAAAACSAAARRSRCHGEYRESVDIDFLVSDTPATRAARAADGPHGLQAIARPGALLEPAREVRADQYGIRTLLARRRRRHQVRDRPRRRASRSRCRARADRVCGVATLTPLDMAASKLLANSDRWATTR